MGWTDYHDRASRHFSEPRNHCLQPGGSEYSRYLWVRSHVPAEARVLDIGSNCGQLAENLYHDLGCDVVGIDVVQEFVAAANAHKPGRFYCADFGALSAWEQLSQGLIGFDVVTALEVIEHDIHLRTLRANVLRALKPGGLFIVTTPHPNGITGYALQGKEPAHVRVWTRQRLETAFTPVFGPMIDYTEIHRDECGRLLSMGAVWRLDGVPTSEDKMPVCAHRQEATP